MTHEEAIELWATRRTQRTACADNERLARILVDNEAIETQLAECRYYSDVLKVIQKLEQKAMEWFCTVVTLGLAQKNWLLAREALEAFEERN